MIRRAAAVLVACGLAGCSGDSGGNSGTAVDSTKRDDVVAALTSAVIVPGYNNLVASTGALSEAIQQLCSAPGDGAALTAAQEAWRAASASWSATRAFRFGPAMELRAMSKIAFPVDPAKVAGLLDGIDAVGREAVAALGADQRGLRGIELVLFGDGAVKGRPCEYISSAIVVVADAASAVADGWTSNPPTDSKQFVDEAVNGLIFALSDVADQQLGKASGDITGTAEFAEIDDGPAHSALADMASMIDSVEMMLSGGAAGIGLDDLIAAQSPDTSARVGAELLAAGAAVDAVPAPLALTSDTGPVSAAYEAVRVPLVTLRAEVASLLGVTLTLGDADGDS